ncbi:DUF3800 domain-containing protein [Collimonas sp. OK412]|uniref:DUF3800 domain-containing protein n=1 Tax=Collimonas sp. (strain OK412) TaxID=1801619 RepID=UPI0008EE1F19|nr:DUF3800 domain-containing protein [Collimonas sp. OK412]SFD18620.1 Protein of unknown function [Collimonas sp. OK412]
MKPAKKLTTLFYMDDSGTRHPDHDAPGSRNRDWFALGGIMINEEDKESAETLIMDFRARWPELDGRPFHSHEIRRRQEGFAWLAVAGSRAELFISELSALLLSLPVVGVACVIDRQGYNDRYKAQYGKDRWLLCKTAFAVAIERAVKQAIVNDRRLKIYVERTSKKTDTLIKSYYQEIKKNGLWFDSEQSSKYKPVLAEQFNMLLYDFKTKTKESLLMQIADLYLWPMCIGGYQPTNKAYMALKEAGKLIDCCLAEEELAERGIKYSCFENVAKRTA